MTDFGALKNQYEELEKLTIDTGMDPENYKLFKGCIATMVLSIWNQQPGYDESYSKAFATMTDVNEVDEATVRSLLDKTANAGNEVAIMQSFVIMVIMESEHQLKRGYSRNFMDKLVDFLTDMAFVNGDCTPEEASKIEEIRQLHMDFRSECMLNRRRVLCGAIKPGTFEYKRKGTNETCVTYVIGNTLDENETPAQLERHISKHRISEDKIEVDMKLAMQHGIDKVKIYGWLNRGYIDVVGQLFAKSGLRDEISVHATVYDQDGDVLQTESMLGYGGGLVRCSLRPEEMFPGHPFKISINMNGYSSEDISKIRFTVC